jgi:hypothetical protein
MPERQIEVAAELRNYTAQNLAEWLTLDGLVAYAKGYDDFESYGAEDEKIEWFKLFFRFVMVEPLGSEDNGSGFVTHRDAFFFKDMVTSRHFRVIEISNSWGDSEYEIAEVVPVQKLSFETLEKTGSNDEHVTTEVHS